MSSIFEFYASSYLGYNAKINNRGEAFDASMGTRHLVLCEIGLEVERSSFAQKSKFYHLKFGSFFFGGGTLFWITENVTFLFDKYGSQYKIHMSGRTIDNVHA